MPYFLAGCAVIQVHEPVHEKLHIVDIRPSLLQKYGLSEPPDYGGPSGSSTTSGGASSHCGAYLYAHGWFLPSADRLHPARRWLSEPGSLHIVRPSSWRLACWNLDHFPAPSLHEWHF